MTESSKSFLILGKGRWAGVIENALQGMGFASTMRGGIRRPHAESWDDYLERWQAQLADEQGDIAWIATPPGDHVPILARAALLADKHVIIEKPWLGTRADAIALVELAARRNRCLAVNYQYLYLEHVQRVAKFRRTILAGNVYCKMCFTIPKPPRSGLTVLQNLGSHLFAIRLFLSENAIVSELELGCRMDNRRMFTIWGERGKKTDHFDFSNNEEPILQRFVRSFVNAVDGGSDWFPTLYFAHRVYESMVEHADSRAMTACRPRALMVFQSKRISDFW